MKPEALNERIKTAQEYFSALSDFLTDWNIEKIYANWEQLTLPQKYAAINPKLYELHVATDEILGPRSFGPEVVRRSGTCMAEFLWGYCCNFGARQLQADHAFPYALGGATDSRNLLILCDVHNQAKGHDVHIYPWPRTEPEWLRETVGRIHRKYLHRQRLSG